ACRKPAPGMLHAIGRSLGIEVAGKHFVGDSLKDIRAARAAGCQPVLVLTGNGLETSRLHHDGIQVYDNLLSFAQDITRPGSRP
ncbi:MAG: HAD hydrolase-like protein, partial [Pseudomonadales bacterium]